MNKLKGFTIIELIVVIAIIAILASIVLINVTGYLNKSKDSAMKENMHTLQTNAISNAVSTLSVNYSAACNDTVWTTAIQGVYTSGTSCTPKADDSAWCACVKELAPSTATYFCIDSTGAVKEQTTNACATECAVTTALCL